MIYSSCINIVAKWYPEKKGWRTGFVNGGFAYGSVPFIYLMGATFHLSNFRPFLIILGIGLGIGLLICSVFFVDPPKGWWPADVDPVKFREDTEQRRLRNRRNPPAVRQWPIELSSRTPQLYLLWLNMVLILAVGLFGIAYTVPAAMSLGWGWRRDGGGPVQLDGLTSVRGLDSEYTGRRRAMQLVFGLMVVGQFVLLWGYEAKSFALFLIGAAITGGCADAVPARHDHRRLLR
jgi:hypothetical protein